MKDFNTVPLGGQFTSGRGRMWRLRYKVQEQMFQSGITQQVLAKKLGCNQGHLSSYIRGARGTSGDNAIDLLFAAAEFLGLSPSEILESADGVQNERTQNAQDFAEALKVAKQNTPQSLVLERSRCAARSWWSPPPECSCLEIDFNDRDLEKIESTSYVKNTLGARIQPDRLNATKVAFEEAWRSGEEVQHSVPFLASEGIYEWVTVVMRRIDTILLCETFASESTVDAVKFHLGLAKT